MTPHARTLAAHSQGSFRTLAQASIIGLVYVIQTTLADRYPQAGPMSAGAAPGTWGFVSPRSIAAAISPTTLCSSLRRPFYAPRHDQRQTAPPILKRHRLDPPGHHTGVPERQHESQRRYDSDEIDLIHWESNADLAERFRSPDAIDGPVQVFRRRVDGALHDQTLEAGVACLLN